MWYDVGSGDAEHQISDGVGRAASATPADGVTVRGAAPDHALLTPQLSDAIGVIHIGRPLTPPGIECTPGDRLNCDGVGHVSVCRW